MSRAGAGELEVGTCFLSAGVTLVTAVTTVVLSITLPGHGYAAAISAPELAVLTCHIHAPSLVWREITLSKTPTLNSFQQHYTEGGCFLN